MTPAISVIIPCFNSGETITETINSVLAQTWSDFELIVVNSGSSDSTDLALGEFDDSRLQIVHASPGNVAVNRNRGLAIARAPFITFLDADDLWSTDKLEVQYKSLLASPDASVCYSWTDCIDEEGRFLFPASRASWEGNVCEKLLQSNFIASGSNFMAYTEAVREIQGFDTSLSNCEDFDACIRLSEKFKFIAVERTQIFYRQSKKSKSQNLLGLERAQIRILEDFFSSHSMSEFDQVKSDSYSNFYLFISLKALSVPHSQCLLSLRYLACSFKWKPAVVFRPDSYKIVFRAVIGLILGERLNTAIVRTLKERKSKRADYPSIAAIRD